MALWAAVIKSLTAPLVGAAGVVVACDDFIGLVVGPSPLRFRVAGLEWRRCLCGVVAAALLQLMAPQSRRTRFRYVIGEGARTNIRNPGGLY